MECKTPYADLLPPLSTEEFEALKSDIKERGVLQPILVDEDDNILDGHNRYRIDKNAPRKVVAGLSELEKQAFVLSSNTKRRNLSPEQKAEIRRVQRELALKLRETDAKRWTQARIGKLFGVRQELICKWMDKSFSKSAKAFKSDARVSVSKQAKAEIVERVEAGETQARVAADYSITQARVSQIVKQERTRTENNAKVEAITAEKTAGEFNGLYDVLVLDPPWPMEKIEREVAPEQSVFDYPTMSEEELAAMTLPSKADAHVWVWTTHKFLPMSLRLLEAWELKYVCAFVWHKPGGFQPFGLPQYNCEFAIYARRGAPAFVDVKAFNVCFDAPRTGHSAKPEAFYETIRRVTSGRRIDIFNRREIEGFDTWGNQA